MITAIPHCNSHNYNFSYNVPIKSWDTNSVSPKSNCSDSGHCSRESPELVGANSPRQLTPCKTDIGPSATALAQAYSFNGYTLTNEMQQTAQSPCFGNPYSTSGLGTTSSTSSGSQNADFDFYNGYGQYMNYYPSQPYGSYAASSGTHSGSTGASSTPYHMANIGSSYSTAFGTNPGTSNTCSSSTLASNYEGMDYSGSYSYNQTNYNYMYNYPSSYGYMSTGATGTTAMNASAAALQMNAHLLNAATIEASPHYAFDSPSPCKSASDIINGSNGGLKKGVKTGRGRGRRPPNPSPDPQNCLERVFIWDLDETLIIFHTLLTHTFPKKYNKDMNLGLSLGLRMEQMIYTFADSHFFFNHLEECDQVHIDDALSDDNGQDLTNYNFDTDGFLDATRTSGAGVVLPGAGSRNGIDWMRKLAFRYRKIKEIYTQHRDKIEVLFNSSEERENWETLRLEIETFTDQWSVIALDCLKIINSRPNSVNVMVTTTHLIPALAKILLYNLGSEFPIENIYSSTKVGKENCFQRIQEKYGRKCTYVVIGDGKDEETAANLLGIPFWPIRNHADLNNFHHALQQDIL